MWSRKTRLSQDDVRILELIAHGHTAQEIADELELAVGTVYEKRARIFHFLGAKNAPHAVYIAIGEGLLV